MGRGRVCVGGLVLPVFAKQFSFISAHFLAVFWQVLLQINCFEMVDLCLKCH